jgi:hypothetical protein
MSKLMKYSALWEEYPDYIFYPDSAEVKKMIGGDVDAKYITNTCAIRLSHALNYHGFPVPGGFADLLTVRGADKKRYALRVKQMRPWLNYRIGKPDFDLKKKAGTAFDKALIAKRNGIIGFDIAFGDATGHLDLWDGARFSSEYKMSQNYWVTSTRISIWDALL